MAFTHNASDGLKNIRQAIELGECLEVEASLMKVGHYAILLVPTNCLWALQDFLPFFFLVRLLFSGTGRLIRQEEG